jgi:hypothetical protein
MCGRHSAWSDDVFGSSTWFSKVRRSWSAAAVLGTITAQLRIRERSE